MDSSDCEEMISHFVINRNRAAELGLQDIKRIENIHIFMLKRKTSPRDIQKLIEDLEKQRKQCEDALTQMKDQLNQAKALQHQTQKKIFELQSSLEMDKDGQQNLMEYSDKPDIVDRDLTFALEHYNEKLKMAIEDILKREADIELVVDLHEIVVKNINDVNYWNDL